MWVMTTEGFYSVVADRDDPDGLLVRARTRQDMCELGRWIPDIEFVETPRADYRWRAHVTRAEWVVALAQIAGRIDYPNFKNEVARRQGSERATLYSRIWTTLRRLQED